MAKAKKPVAQERATVRVRATGPGLYDHFREAGDEFMISGDVYVQGDVVPAGKEVGDVKAFSDRWMELVKADAAE